METQTEQAEVKEDSVTDVYEEITEEPVKAVYDHESGKVSYQYISQEHGIKEQIVLSEKPENNAFSFLLEMPGMTIKKNPVGEGLTVYKDDTIAAYIQEPNMDDASGNAYSEDASYDVKTVDEEAGKYLLTLNVSEKYLNAKGPSVPGYHRSYSGVV